MGQSEGKSIYELHVPNEIKTEMETEITEMLGFKPWAPRHRCWEVDGETPRITTRGRCGGDNREANQYNISIMECGDNFIKAYDSDFDETYRFFVYSLPMEAWKRFVTKWAKYNTLSEPAKDVSPELVIIQTKPHQDTETKKTMKPTIFDDMIQAKEELESEMVVNAILSKIKEIKDEKKTTNSSSSSDALSDVLIHQKEMETRMFMYHMDRKISSIRKSYNFVDNYHSLNTNNTQPLSIDSYYLKYTTDINRSAVELLSFQLKRVEVYDFTMNQTTKEKVQAFFLESPFLFE